MLGYPCACFALCWVSSRVFCACLCGRCCAVSVCLFLRACRCWVSAVLGVTVCACLWVSALVCVPVVSALCLWCALLRCGCLCGRFCPVWCCGCLQVLRCVVRFNAALWCCVCAFFNKNKGLQRFLNEMDYMRIIYRLCADYIIYYLSPPHGDNRDNAEVFFRPKKGISKIWRPPPSKVLQPCFYRPPLLWKS